jgi:hypothetical protein
MRRLPTSLALLTATLPALAPYAGSSAATAPAAPTAPTAATARTAATAPSADARASAHGVAPVPVPKAGRAVDTSRPDRVVGNGTPGSCTSRKVVRAVAKGGVITFDCGPDPVVIEMRRTAKVFNKVGGRVTRRVVLDGGGLVTLDGMGQRRILYQDTCDKRQVQTTSDCYDQPYPKLVVQHLTLTHAYSPAHGGEREGGGAIFARGGQVRIVDSTFVRNRCYPSGRDLGGAAVRALGQYHHRPVYVVHSTFTGGRCSNGSALSSIGVSWSVLNSVFRDNRALGHGANPQRPGTKGGGSGGAIYTDGDRYTLRVAGTLMRRNHANEGGGAIFYVSNDHTGRLRIHWSTLKGNVSDGFETRPGIFYIGRGPIDVRHSVIR